MNKHENMHFCINEIPSYGRGTIKTKKDLHNLVERATPKDFVYIGGIGYQCSNCKIEYPYETINDLKLISEVKFCPNCGQALLKGNTYEL